MPFFPSSFDLYSIAHPDKNGVPLINLSEDPEAYVPDPENFTAVQLSIERVITKVLHKYGVDINVCDNLRSIFKAKLWRMGKALSKAGGTKRKEILSKWSSGKDSIWAIKIHLPFSKNELYQKKRKAELELSQECHKRKKLELALKEANQASRILAKTTRKQAHVIAKLSAGKSLKARGSSSKPWQLLSRQRRAIRKRQLVADVQASLSVCDSSAFCPISLDVKNIHTGERESISLEKGRFSRKCAEEQRLSEAEQLQIALYVKEKFCISDEAFHELSMIFKGLPRSHVLKNLATELNSQVNVFLTPNNTTGVQMSLRARIIVTVERLLSTATPCRDRLLSEKKLRIKLTEDGTNLGRSLHVVNVAFCVLDEERAGTSPYGNHSLAILKVAEKYEQLALALEDVRVEVAQLDSILINDEVFEIELFLGGDWKFLAIVCGIDAAHSQHFCVWCKCPSSD